MSVGVMCVMHQSLITVG